ncbi:coiled-coil domain-containing protein 22 homolog [Neocloeon triangulifer]|uniref:coiled-coil domain-containing protein 22 homolog n=1 Tax=Neocloeon triangulifer TaxID=2078957 RepID=UPI00286FA6F6|nr:coiled-coil domain-containing protein 22 homolog [Neocloeon triangulifer]
MEDVDKIIIHSLRQVGCELDEDIRSIGQFSTELVVEATARCLKSINPEVDAPLSMPPSMSVRFRIGATLAQACQDLGYKGEIGYQTFLYSTEADIRKVFMFLMELLPKESEKLPVVPLDKNYLQRQKVVYTLKQQISKPWLPVKCRRKGIISTPSGPFVDPLTLTSSQFSSVPLDPVWPITGQLPDMRQLMPSLIVLNESCLTSAEALVLTRVKDWNSVFTLEKPALPPKPKFDKVDVAIKKEVEEKLEEVPLKNEEMIIEELQEEVSELMAQIESAQSDLILNKSKILEISNQSKSLEEEVKCRDEKLMRERKVAKLLPEAEENMQKLDDLIKEEVKKLLSLASKWDKHRAPLIEQYRDLRQNSHHLTEAQMQAEIARGVEEKLKELAIEVKDKEQLQGRLKIEYEKMNKDISRSSYTRRIFEIIGNIKKQKEDIDKILADTRMVQKDINQLSGRLDRSFAVTDEMIFKDAKREETSRNAYKLLATLHNDCSKIVKFVEETGSILREIRDLEDQIETETSKNISANLERITADLVQMRKESAALSAQLKSFSS